MRRCATCDRPLASHARADALYCSGRCRVIAHRRRQRGAALPRSDLARLVEAAGSLAEPPLVAGIQEAARLDWQAAAWLLERHYPERWGAAAGRVRREPDLLDGPH